MPRLLDHLALRAPDAGLDDTTLSMDVGDIVLSHEDQDWHVYLGEPAHRRPQKADLEIAPVTQVLRVIDERLVERSARRGVVTRDLIDVLGPIQRGRPDVAVLEGRTVLSAPLVEMLRARHAVDHGSNQHQLLDLLRLPDG